MSAELEREAESYEVELWKDGRMLYKAVFQIPGRFLWYHRESGYGLDIKPVRADQ